MLYQIGALDLDLIMVRSTRFLAILALGAANLLLTQRSFAQIPATESLQALSIKAREARIKGDVPNWLSYATKTLALAPDHPDLLISVARANAAAGNKMASIALLKEAARRGAGIDPSRLAEFKSMIGDPQFDQAAAAAKRTLSPVARAVSFAPVPNSEGIAYDPVSRRFFSGTEREGGVGEIYSVSGDGKLRTFATGHGLRQILGVKADPKRRLLWVVNGRYPDITYTDANRPADVGTGGVRAYNIDNQALVRVVETDDRPTSVHGFNDLALAPDGTVFVTDTNTQAVYRLSPGAKSLELLLRDAHMTFPNGIVISPDARTLYVAHVEGISAIDIASRRRHLLKVPPDGSVNSIDGLLLHEGNFYGVQGSPYLQRIVGATISKDGHSITRVWTVNSHTPVGFSQTTAAIAGQYLYMIGGFPTPDIYGAGNSIKPDYRIWKVPLKD